MHALLSTVALESEARLLFVLADTAAQNRQMPAEIEDTWRAARARIAQTNNYEVEGPLLYELLLRLEASGALAGTWLEHRWLIVKRRVEAAPCE